MRCSFSLEGKKTELSSFDSLKELHGAFADWNPRRTLLWVADTNSEVYLPPSAKQRIILPPGEREKDLESVKTIIDQALSIKAGRDALFVALGGGVICDMTAFAASIYMRGVPVLLIPSTLLCMVDASLGGKCGVDYRNRKNMIGTFYPAEKVYLCPELLFSLPADQLRNGLAEMIKHGMLAGEEDLEKIEDSAGAIINGRLEAIEDLLTENVAIKGRYVESDPKEKGIRAHLNLGHTFGHALESAGELSDWNHGEAVAWGLVRALSASVKLGRCDLSYLERISALLERLGYRLRADVPPGAIIDALESDKKRKEGRIHFVLQEGPGETFTSPLDKELLEETIREGCC
jgi:3-dehydroquinate synthase